MDDHQRDATPQPSIPVDALNIFLEFGAEGRSYAWLWDTLSARGFVRSETGATEQEPIAWRYRPKGGNGSWRYVDRAEDCNPGRIYEREPLYGMPWAESHQSAIQEMQIADMLLDFARGRCPACGWALAMRASEGCVPFNCSFRPSEGSEEHSRWLPRAKAMQAVLDWVRSKDAAPSAQSATRRSDRQMGDTIVYMGTEARKKQILDCIRDNPGIFNKRISEKLCLARSRIDTLTRELFRDGLIRREIDSLRRNLWYLTDAKPLQK